jgi:TM2 domain-containing membrane protein YozV
MIINNNNNHVDFRPAPRMIQAPTATNVLEILKAFGNDKTRIHMVLLSSLLGWSGAHKFYIRKFAYGIVYLLVSALLIPGIICLGLGLESYLDSEPSNNIFRTGAVLTAAGMIPGILGIGEAIYWFSMSDADFAAHIASD